MDAITIPGPTSSRDLVAHAVPAPTSGNASETNPPIPAHGWEAPSALAEGRVEPCEPGSVSDAGDCADYRSHPGAAGGPSGSRNPPQR